MAPPPIQQTISADLRAFEEVHYRGCVEAFDLEHGVAGWAINLESPGNKLSLELMIDGLVIFAFDTTNPREDLTKFFPNENVAPGFVVVPRFFENIRNFMHVHPTAAFGIRIAGTPYLLPQESNIPSLRTIVEACVQARHLNDDGVSLLGHLTQLRSQARQLLRNPLRPSDEYRSGFIEAICIEDQGANLFWCLGWTKEEGLEDQPAILADRQKFAAAFSTVTYSREDLPADARAYIGVIHAEWRIRSDSKPILYFGPRGQQHLVGLQNLPRISKAGIIEQIQHARSKAPLGNWSDLLRLLHGTHSWFTVGGNPSDIRIAIDEMYILPQFGCFIRGWVISPLRPVESFVLKVGETIMTMDPTSLYFRARPDLTTVFPDAAKLAEKAGFCCFFRGRVDASITSKPLFKILLENQGSSVHEIDVPNIRRLAHSEDIETLLALYPALASEAFFPDLAHAIGEEYRSSVSHIRVHKISQSNCALVVSLSESLHDNYLTFENLRQNSTKYLPETSGIAIIANSEHMHGLLLELFESLDRELLGRCSLVFVPSCDASFYNLSELLLILKANRFIFISPRHQLTHLGWTSALGLLDSTRSDIVFLGVRDPASLLAISDDHSCFSWTRRDYSTWSKRIPTVIDGFPPIEDFPDAAQASPRIENAVSISTRRQLSRVASLVNRANRATTHDRGQ